jgi:hypothetical protein
MFIRESLFLAMGDLVRRRCLQRGRR